MNVRFEGAWEEWVLFFLRGVRSTSIEASSAAREILAIQNRDKNKIKEKLSKHKISFAAYDHICRKAIFTIPELVEALDATYPTVKTVVDGFCTEGIISPYGQKERNRQYQYFDYLNVLRRGT